MPALEPSCLDDTAIALFVGGGLDAAERPAVERHLDTCADCRRTVAALAGPESELATRDERGGRPPLAAREALIAAAQHVGRYLIVAPVGSGAMGTVYLARDPKLDRRLAIKVLRASALDPDGQARLLREAQAMARVDHPNVVTVYDIGEHDGQVFVALEYVGGGNLRKWLGGNRGWREVATTFLAAARGLAAVHDAGLVHRDFKPDNVLIGEDGSVHVGDFGLVSSAMVAALADPVAATTSDLDVSLTATGCVVGTPAYMAPEQFLGQTVDARSDQFAFCAALFEGLYGVRPFEGNDVQTLSRAVLAGAQRAVDRGRVPRALHAIVRRGLARTPEHRFGSMHEVMAAIERVLARRRRLAIVASAAVGIVLLGGAIGFAATRERATAAAASPCAGGERELAGIWDAPRRAAAGERFRQPAVAYAADTWNLVSKNLDAYAAAWVRSHRAACEATRVSHTQPEPVMAARMSCLADRKARLRALSDELVTPSTNEALPVITKASRLVGELPSVESCDALTEPELARAAPAATWQQIAPIEEALRRLETVAAITDIAAVPDLERLIAQADETGFAPLRGRARLVLGRILLGTEDPEAFDKAIPILAKAVQLADEGRDDETRATALGMLTLAALGKLDRASARTHFDSWRSAVLRSGAVPEDQTWFVTARGMLAVFEGKVRDAEEDAARIDQLLAKRPEELTEQADMLSFFAHAATEYAAPAQQLEHAERLLEVSRRQFGPLHPTTIDMESLVAAALYYLHRYDEAERAYKRVLELASTPGYETGDEHVALGAIYRETGRLAAAERELQLEAADPTHETAQLAYHRGLLAYERGDLRKATALLVDARTQLERWLPADHPFMAQMWSALAAAERRRGKLDAALAAAKRAQEILTTMQGESHRHAEALAEVGLAAAALGKSDAARTALEASIAASDRGSILPVHLAEVKVTLARLVRPSDPARARTLAEAAAAAAAASKSRWAAPVKKQAAALLE